MQIIIDIFNLLFFGPIVNLLILILRTLESFSIPGALGFSVIVLTILIRILVWPFMASQLKSAKKMADLKPHLDVLKKNHGSDKQALAAAQMALYKQHGVSPAGGCLPALVQFPVLIALYQTIYAFFETHGLDRINSVLYNSSWHLSSSPSSDFFGINLASKPSDFTSLGFGLLLIPIVTALLQLIQSKMMIASPVSKYPSDSPKEKKEKVEVEDSMMAIQSQMVFMLPIMVGYFAFQFPIALALYWNTVTLISIFQQYLIAGLGGLNDWINLAKKLKLSK